MKPFISFVKKEFGQSLSSPLFWLPLIVKIVASVFLASHFATDLFIPFLKFYVTSGGQDPFAHFHAIGATDAFPYPSLMLWMLAPAFAFFNLFSEMAAQGVTYLDIFTLKIPLLLADFGILMVLLSWFRKKQREALVLYWCSPILFYISYIHGQLDALPIFLLFCFLYFLFKERDIAALIFLGLAISAKTGMIIVLPFVFFYLLKERRLILSTVGKSLIPLGIFLVLNLHQLFNPAFIEMVLKTREQFKVFDLVFSYNGNLFIYIIPVVYLILLFKFALYKRYSRDLFMVFLGFGFSILTLFIAPMPGWYFWVIPFAAYFYVNAPNRHRVLYYSLIPSYLLYFAAIPDSDFLAVFTPISENMGLVGSLYNFIERAGLPPDLFVNISFTLLQTVLLINIYWMYRKGVERYVQYKMHYKPYLIGVAGDSGSGKTTFADLMNDVFAKRNVSVIAGDDLHKWERGNEMWTKYTHLDPRANKLHTDIESVYSIKRGAPIHRRRYDHVSGKFMLPEKFESKRLVIFEGLHSLFLEKIRRAFDLKVFISPEDQLKHHWKIIRDFEQRGHKKKTVIEQIQARQTDVDKYIKVQEKYSDIVITLKNEFDLGDKVGDKNIRLSLVLEVTCANDVGLQSLLDELSKHMSVDYMVRDEKQTIKFSGKISKENVEEISRVILPELDELSIEQRDWHSDYNGVIQLFTTFYIFESMRLEHYDQ